MWSRFATLLLVVVCAAACQLQAQTSEPAEITLTSRATTEARAEATDEPIGSNEDDDLGLLVVGAPPTDIVAITPTGGISSAPMQPAPAGRCTATPNGRYDVNIRDGAGTQYVLGGVLRYGDYIDAYGRTNSGWIQVDIPGTGFGWVSSSVVTLNGPCNLQIVGENVGNTTSITAAPPVNATPTSRFLGGGSGYIYVTTRQVGVIPANTQVSIDSAYYDGSQYVYGLTTRDGKSAEARDADLAYAPGITPGAPTPTPAFDSSWGFSFVTTAQVGNIPANTRIRIGGITWDGYEWLYQITTDNITTIDARESQIGFYPGINPVGATPTSPIGMTFASGYVYVTTQAVGQIPAGTRVAIGSMYFDGYGWMYQVTTREGLAAELRDSQFDFAPDFNPVAPTPTMAFNSVLGMGVSWVVTTERIGSIPANSRVRVSTAWYDGYDWIYQIATDNGTFAEARQSQLAWAPDATPGFTPQPSVVECRAMANTAFGVVNIRSGPGAHFAALNAFGTNDAVSVLGRSDNGWYLVKMYAFGNAFEGFAPAGEIALSGDCNNLTVIPAASFESTPEVQGLPTDASPSDVVIPEGLCTVIATTSNVNITSENRADSTVVGVLQPGPWLQANARDGKGWYRVTLLSGGLGWVNGSQLQVNGLGAACDLLIVLRFFPERRTLWIGRGMVLRPF